MVLLTEEEKARRLTELIQGLIVKARSCAAELNISGNEQAIDVAMKLYKLCDDAETKLRK
jgi:hypothetical protein